MGTNDEILKELLETDQLKYCFQCGVCTASCPMMELLPHHYNPRSLLQGLPFDPEKVMNGTAIWLCAWCYRCHRRCPQGLKVPELLLQMKDAAAERGNLEAFKEAQDIIKNEMPLPAVCTYICFNPLHGHVDKPQVAEALESFITEYEHMIKGEEPPPITHDERIAIVGSGPAGLTAAWELAGKGYPVTVFECLPEAGGMPRRCIPEFRLPSKALDADIQRIENRGVDIRTGTKAPELDDLLEEGYQAVFVATGLHMSRRIGIAGEDLEGVFDVLGFLSGTKTGTRFDLGDKVVIIGGGNVAMDAARTVLRLGAKEAHIVCGESRQEMPAFEPEIEEAVKEGVVLHPARMPTRIIGANGRCTGVESLKCLSVLDPLGFFCPKVESGTESVVEADSIIVAIGMALDRGILRAFKLAGRGTIIADPFSMETSRSIVFAGGDAVSGPASAMEAIIAGKRAATSIDKYLADRTEGS